MQLCKQIHQENKGPRLCVFVETFNLHSTGLGLHLLLLFFFHLQTLETPRYFALYTVKTFDAYLRQQLYRKLDAVAVGL